MIRRSLIAAALLATLGAAPAFAQGCDTRFDIVNRSSQVVEELYFSSSRQNDWGPDQLGNDVLAIGASMRYTAANPGAYDFKVVWVGGRSAELRQIDICRASRITVTDRGLIAE